MRALSILFDLWLSHGEREHRVLIVMKFLNCTISFDPEKFFATFIEVVALGEVDWVGNLVTDACDVVVLFAAQNVL